MFDIALEFIHQFNEHLVEFVLFAIVLSMIGHMVFSRR